MWIRADVDLYCNIDENVPARLSRVVVDISVLLINERSQLGTGFVFYIGLEAYFRCNIRPLHVLMSQLTPGPAWYC